MQHAAALGLWVPGPLPLLLPTHAVHAACPRADRGRGRGAGDCNDPGPRQVPWQERQLRCRISPPSGIWKNNARDSISGRNQQRRHLGPVKSDVLKYTPLAFGHPRLQHAIPVTCFPQTEPASWSQPAGAAPVPSGAASSPSGAAPAGRPAGAASLPGAGAPPPNHHPLCGTKEPRREGREIGGINPFVQPFFNDFRWLGSGKSMVGRSWICWSWMVPNPLHHMGHRYW
jgi:hypothetical protein